MRRIFGGSCLPWVWWLPLPFSVVGCKGIFTGSPRRSAWSRRLIHQKRTENRTRRTTLYEGCYPVFEKRRGESPTDLVASFTGNDPAQSNLYHFRGSGSRPTTCRRQIHFFNSYNLIFRSRVDRSI